MIHKAFATLGETDAMQTGRDDYQYWIACCPRDIPASPFPQDSVEQQDWQEGWNRERDGK